VRDRPSRPTGRGQCLLRDAVGGGPQPPGRPGEVSLARPSAQRRAIARPPRTQRPGCARGASCESVAERSRKPPSRWGSALGPALRSSSVPPPGEGATSPREASATPAQPEVLSPGNLLGAGWGDSHRAVPRQLGRADLASVQSGLLPLERRLGASGPPRPSCRASRRRRRPGAHRRSAWTAIADNLVAITGYKAARINRSPRRGIRPTS
jgi:hypothetical protein